MASAEELEQRLRSARAQLRTGSDEIQMRLAIEREVEAQVPRKLGTARDTDRQFLRNKLKEMLGTGQVRLEAGELTRVVQERLPERAEDIAREAGVATTGAPAATRALASLPPQQSLEVVRKALRRTEGRDVEVRLGPETGQVEFKNEQGQFTLFNEPNLEPGDFAGLAGPAITATGDIVGGAAGFVAGSAAGRPVAGTIAGTGLGATVAETGRRQLAARLGLMKDEPVLESAKTAAREAGAPAAIGAGLGAGVATLGSARRAAQSRPIGRLPEGAEKPEFQTAFTAGVEEAGSLAGLAEREVARSRVGEAGAVEVAAPEVRFTAGQILPEETTGAAIFETERRLARQEGVGDPLREIYEEQQQIAADLFESEARVLGLEGEAADAYTVGRSVQGETRRQLQVAEAAENRAVAETEQEARSAVAGTVTREDAIDRMARGDTAMVGRPTRVVATREQKEFSRVTAVKYKQLDEVAQQTVGRSEIPVGGFNAEAKKSLDILDESVIKLLDEGDRAVVGQALLAGKPTAAEMKALGFGQEEIDLMLRQPGTLRFSQIQATLQALRKLERATVTGQTPDLQRRTLVRLRTALQKDRADFVEGHPVLAAKIDEAETFVSQGKRRLDESLVGDLVQIRSGQPAVADSDFFGKVILRGDEVDAKQVAGLLRNPTLPVTTEEAALFDTALTAWQRGIRDLYNERVVSLETGLPDPRKHRKFMRDFGDQIRPFFQPDEVRRLERVGELGRIVEQRSALRDEVLEQVRRQIDPLDLDKVKTPGDAARVIWERGDAGAIEAFRRTVGADESLLRLMRSHAHRDIRRRISADAGENARFDFKKLGKVVADDAGKIEALFGKKYLDNLRLLNRFVRRAQKGPPRELKTSGPLKVQTVDPVGVMSLVRRATLGVLTVRRRLFTGARQMQLKAAERALVQALADPETLAQMMAIRSQPLRSAAWLEILGSLGALAAVGEDLPERAPRPKRSGVLSPQELRDIGIATQGIGP